MRTFKAIVSTDSLPFTPSCKVETMTISENTPFCKPISSP